MCALASSCMVYTSMWIVVADPVTCRHGSTGLDLRYGWTVHMSRCAVGLWGSLCSAVLTSSRLWSRCLRLRRHKVSRCVTYVGCDNQHGWTHDVLGKSDWWQVITWTCEHFALWEPWAYWWKCYFYSLLSQFWTDTPIWILLNCVIQNKHFLIKLSLSCTLPLTCYLRVAVV